MLQCDIIGDPSNYPDEWTALGNELFGTPLLVGENGEDLIPAGPSIHMKLTRKCKELVLWIYSSDNGVTWSVNTANGVSACEGINNGVTQGMPTGRLDMFFYTTEASSMELADNAEVLALGDVAAFSGPYQGTELTAHLIGKIPIGGTNVRTFTTPLTSKGIKPSAALLYGDANYGDVAHDVLGLFGQDTPAVKVLSYLTRENGKAYLQLLYKEMIYDVDWGDDSKFDIVDGESTTTDDNGNTVKIGQKRIELPYFVSDGD